MSSAENREIYRFLKVQFKPVFVETGICFYFTKYPPPKKLNLSLNQNPESWKNRQRVLNLWLWEICQLYLVHLVRQSDY